MAKTSKNAVPNLALAVADLGLPVRAVNALRAGGIETVGDIVEWPERELRALPNCGPATMAALREIAERAGAKRRRIEATQATTTEQQTDGDGQCETKSLP